MTKQEYQNAIDVALALAPIGTRAPAVYGSGWEKTKEGWRWMDYGGVSPRPGGNWNGQLIYAGETLELTVAG